MALYRTAEGTDRFHDGFVSYPPNTEIERPDDEVPSITFIPIDDAARAAMAKRRADITARAKKRADNVRERDPELADKIEVEAAAKLKEADDAIARAHAEAELVTPVRMAPQSMSELALQRPQASHERGRKRGGDKGQG